MPYIDFHPTIHAIGDDACIAAFINGDATEFEDMALTTARHYAMGSNTQLTRVSLPLLNQGLPYAFNGCISLTELNIPRCSGMNISLAAGCSALKSIDVDVYTEFNNLCFSNTSLETIILRGVRVISPLFHIGAFTNTPIANGAGYIYVPKKMLNGADGITTYERATNWSAFAGQFRYIEDYPEITGGW